MSDEDRKKMALALLNSTRGSYIIGQALDVAIQKMELEPKKFRESSNIVDMRLLRDELFPIALVARKAKEEFEAKAQREFEDSRR